MKRFWVQKIFFIHISREQTLMFSLEHQMKLKLINKVAQLHLRKFRDSLKLRGEKWDVWRNRNPENRNFISSNSPLALVILVLFLVQCSNSSESERHMMKHWIEFTQVHFDQSFSYLLTSNFVLWKEEQTFLRYIRFQLIEKNGWMSRSNRAAEF